MSWRFRKKDARTASQTQSICRKVYMLLLLLCISLNEKEMICGKTEHSLRRCAAQSIQANWNLIYYLMLDHYSVGFVWHDETIKKEEMGSPKWSLKWYHFSYLGKGVRLESGCWFYEVWALSKHHINLWRRINCVHKYLIIRSYAKLSTGSYTIFFNVTFCWLQRKAFLDIWYF